MPLCSVVASPQSLFLRNVPSNNPVMKETAFRQGIMHMEFSILTASTGLPGYGLPFCLHPAISELSIWKYRYTNNDFKEEQYSGMAKSNTQQIWAVRAHSATFSNVSYPESAFLGRRNSVSTWPNDHATTSRRYGRGLTSINLTFLRSITYSMLFFLYVKDLARTCELVLEIRDSYRLLGQ